MVPFFSNKALIVLPSFLKLASYLPFSFSHLVATPGNCFVKLVFTDVGTLPASIFCADAAKEIAIIYALNVTIFFIIIFYIDLKIKHDSVGNL